MARTLTGTVANEGTSESNDAGFSKRSSTSNETATSTKNGTRASSGSSNKTGTSIQKANIAARISFSIPILGRVPMDPSSTSC